MKYIAYRRKRTGKTDYQLRRGLLTSKQVRFVIRASLKYITIQAVRYEPQGDKILCAASSRELHALGIKGNLSNTPSAYLTGMLIGKKAQQQGITNGIIDLGMNITTKGNKLFAAIAGLTAAGLQVPHDTKKFPTKERMQGEHLNAEAQKAFKTAQQKITQ